MSKSEASGSKVLKGAMTAGGWFLSFIRGVLLLLLALFALISPDQALLIIVLVFGAYLLIDGLITSVAAIRGRGGSSRMIVLVRGALSIIGGILVLTLPFIFTEISTVIWAYLLGAIAIIAGITDLFTIGKAYREIDSKTTMLINALLLVLLGILLFALPYLYNNDMSMYIILTIAALGVVSLVIAYFQRLAVIKNQIAFK